LIHFLVFDETFFRLLYVLHQQNIVKELYFQSLIKTAANHMPLSLSGEYPIFSFSLKGASSQTCDTDLPQKLACLTLIRHSFQICAR